MFLLFLSNKYFSHLMKKKISKAEGKLPLEVLFSFSRQIFALVKETMFEFQLSVLATWMVSLYCLFFLLLLETFFFFFKEKET